MRDLLSMPLRVRQEWREGSAFVRGVKGFKPFTRAALPTQLSDLCCLLDSKATVNAKPPLELRSRKDDVIRW